MEFLLSVRFLQTYCLGIKVLGHLLKKDTGNFILVYLHVQIYNLCQNNITLVGDQIRDFVG